SGWRFRSGCHKSAPRTAKYRRLRMGARKVAPAEGLPQPRSQLDERTRIFDAQRARLFGLAYRMLGSRADAEDVLQDAYLRWQASAAQPIENPSAWLRTVATRLSIDRLRRLQVEREAYFGPWLPEPLSPTDYATPEQAAELDGDVSIAFLVVLEALAPEERAAFLLHDVL